MESETHLGSKKIKVYRAVFLTTLLYGCETWKTYQQHIKKLNHFHTTYLRKILGITWKKHILNTEVLSQASLSSFYTIVMQSQLRWTSQVVHMKDHRLSKKLLNSELSQGKRSQWVQKKRFKDTLKVPMKSFSIAPNCLEYLARDRDKWREVVKRGAKVWGTKRNAATELDRKLTKVPVTSATASTICCSHCPRLFRSQIHLISHLHAHRDGYFYLKKNKKKQNSFIEEKISIGVQATFFTILKTEWRFIKTVTL